MKSMTVFHIFSLYTVLLQIFVELVGMTSGIRNKRVLYGLPTQAGDRDEYYPHFRYYVFLAKPDFIGQIDEDPSWIKKWLKISLNPKPDWLHCSGSLLTPSIVQTACHCVGKFTRRKGNFTIGVPKSTWEDRIYSYVGSNIVWELYYFLVPHRYIVHSSCRQASSDGPESLRHIMYDFAVIVNEQSIFERAEGAEISYLPVYRGVDIRNFYYIAIKKEYTCLFVGFGDWKATTVYGHVMTEDSPSEVLRWGWRSLRSYKDCMAIACPPELLRLGVYDYREHTTASCFSTTAKDGYHHASHSGDSGGPVSCNNVYFAVQSGGRYHENSRLYETLATPIAYSTFENAAESRADFIKYCNEIGDDLEVRPPRPPDVNKPTPPRPRRSQCPPKMILYRFMILSSTIVVWLSYHC